MDKHVPPPFNDKPVTVRVSSTSDLALPMVREACLRARFGAEFPDRGADLVKVGLDKENQNPTSVLLRSTRTRLGALALSVRPDSGDISIAAEFGATTTERDQWEAIATLYLDREGDQDHVQQTFYAPLTGLDDRDPVAAKKAIGDALTEHVTNWLTERFVEVGRQMRAAKRRDDLLDLRRDPEGAYHDLIISPSARPITLRLPLKERGGRTAFRWPDLRGRWHETEVLGRRLAELIPIEVDLLAGDDRDATLLQVMGRAAERETLLFDRKWTKKLDYDEPGHWTVANDRQRQRIKDKVVLVVRNVMTPRTWAGSLGVWLERYGAKSAPEAVIFAHQDADQAWPRPARSIIRLVNLPHRRPTG